MSAAKPGEVLPMQVTTLDDAVAEALAGEKAYCEHCGVELPLWPPDEVRAHVYEKHSATFWPQALKMYERFLREPASVAHNVAIQQNRAEYLVKILAVRFDLYQKLVAAGVIIAPQKG
jgi:hypothetical protein